MFVTRPLCLPYRLTHRDAIRCTQRRRLSRRSLIIVLASWSVLSGCSQSKEGVACAQLALEGPQLLFPIPNATGVPIAAGEFVFQGIPAVAELQSTNGVKTDLGSTMTTSALPLPSPLASPAALDGTREFVEHPTLMPATAYTVTFASPSLEACGPIVSGSYRFSTQ